MALQWSSRWEQQRWLARGQKSYWWVLADNSSLLCFGLPQADTISISSVIIQKSSAAACLSRMLKDLEATSRHPCRKGQSWQGKGAADPLWGMHWAPRTPLFLLLEANRGLWVQREGLQGLERLVRMCSSEPLPATCCHRTDLGKTAEKQVGGERQGLAWGWGGPACGLPTVTESKQWRYSPFYGNEDFRRAGAGRATWVHFGTPHPCLTRTSNRQWLQAGTAHQEQPGVLHGAAVLTGITVSQLPSSLARWHCLGTAPSGHLQPLTCCEQRWWWKCVWAHDRSAWSSSYFPSPLFGCEETVRPNKPQTRWEWVAEPLISALC